MRAQISNSLKTMNPLVTMLCLASFCACGSADTADDSEFAELASELSAGVGQPDGEELAADQQATPADSQPMGGGEPVTGSDELSAGGGEPSAGSSEPQAPAGSPACSETLACPSGLYCHSDCHLYDQNRNETACKQDDRCEFTSRPYCGTKDSSVAISCYIADKADCEATAGCWLSSTAGCQPQTLCVGQPESLCEASPTCIWADNSCQSTCSGLSEGDCADLAHCEMRSVWDCYPRASSFECKAPAPAGEACYRIYGDPGRDDSCAAGLQCGYNYISSNPNFLTCK